MYSKVEPFYDPIEEPCKLMSPIEDDLPLGEMSREEQAFVCGLIKSQRPHKVLEIGVAAGGTTSVIMNCLSTINPDAVMYSVDLNERYYRKPDKAKTGYLFEQIDSIMKLKARHEFLLGKSLPFRIDEIGNDIDFVILDTMHILPGEILDYLCVLPFLSDGAIVVVHDVNYNMISSYQNATYAFATKILLSSVSAEKKYYDLGDNHTNIGAFSIDDRTRNDVWNVFSSLSISWGYMPEMADLKKYSEIYSRYYTSIGINEKWLMTLMFLQEKIIAKNCENLESEWESIIKRARRYRGIYIYGTGLKGKKIDELLMGVEGVEVRGFCVSDKFKIEKEGLRHEVFRLGDVFVEHEIVIIATGCIECYFNLIQMEIPHIIVSDRFWETYQCL